MDDDLNTAVALGELFELARPLRALANRLRIGELPTEADLALESRWQLLVELAGVLGLEPDRQGGGSGPQSGGGGELPDLVEGTSRTAAPAGLSDAAIEALVAQRKAAKAARDFVSADRLRDQLKAQGIDLVDKPGGVTVWLRG